MKTNLDSMYKTDESLEKDGVWMQYGPSEFLVRRMGGKNAEILQQAIARYHKPYARQIANGSLSTKKSTEITANVFIEVCLLDWKNVVIDDEEKPFDKKMAFEYFMHLPELLAELYEQSTVVENYREDLGNS